MFNYKLKRGNYLFNVTVLMLIFTLLGMAPLVSLAFAVPGGLITGTLMNFVRSGAGLAYMAVQKEVWQTDIEEQIFKDNAFVRLSFRADDFVNGRAVHIPQSGGAGGVVKNRTQLPANVRKRTDTDVIYLIDEFTTDPVLIPNADDAELTYDKRNSVLGEDKNKLSQVIAEEMLYNWLHNQDGTTLPAASIIKTTGPAIPATAPGATGNRKAATINDLQRAATFLRNQNYWFEGQMHSLQPANLHAQIFPADSLTTATYMQSATEDERRKGLIMKAQGFGILSRSTVVIVSSAGVIKAPGAAAEAGDCEGILCWYTNAVETAYGSVKMFEQAGSPEYYGDLYSFLCRMGGRARRADYKGMVLLVQDVAA